MKLNPRILFFKSSENWQDIKNATMNTIGKEKGVYPSSFWKRQLLMAEHSPIRKLKLSWRWVDLPYWVSVHFVRHKIGIEHFVKTQRTDRTGIERDGLPQGAPVNHECEADAQALITISRKRLCSAAAEETRAAWQLVKDEVAKVEPELATCMVRECVYRGHCPEMFPCGYTKTPQFETDCERYRSLLGFVNYKGHVVAVHEHRYFSRKSGKAFYCEVFERPEDYFEADEKTPNFRMYAYPFEDSVYSIHIPSDSEKDVVAGVKQYIDTYLSNKT